MYIPYFVNQGFHYNYVGRPPIINQPLFMEETIEDMWSYIGLEFDTFMDKYFGLRRAVK